MEIIQTTYFCENCSLKLDTMATEAFYLCPVLQQSPQINTIDHESQNQHTEKYLCPRDIAPHSQIQRELKLKSGL